MMALNDDQKFGTEEYLRFLRDANPGKTRAELVDMARVAWSTAFGEENAREAAEWLLR